MFFYRTDIESSLTYLRLLQEPSGLFAGVLIVFACRYFRAGIFSARRFGRHVCNKMVLYVEFPIM